MTKPLGEIIGQGRTKCSEHWTRSLVDLAVKAAGGALDECGLEPTAVIVGNALSGCLGDQRNLAAFVADRLALRGVETHGVEADEASGGSAMRLALALIGAGIHERVLVIGVEKTTDALPDGLEAARATGLDVQREAGFGFGPQVAAGLLMQRYLEQHQVERDLFYHLSAVAHDHARHNELALLAWPLGLEQYQNSPKVAGPLNVCDSAPQCDGAAALVVCRPGAGVKTAVRIIGSHAVSKRPGISQAAVDLDLEAARISAAAALAQSGMTLGDLSLLELHDSSSVIAALSLEAVGAAEPGRAPRLAADGALGLAGPYPSWTFGGNKARGQACGASGVYQLVEATLQLRGEAGANQVAGARTALVQCLGSFGATAVTHVVAG